METSLDQEIRQRVAAVLDRKSTLQEFYRWFMPAAWEVERIDDPEVLRLTYDLTHFFSELSAGILTPEEIRQTLEAAAKPSSQIECESPPHNLEGSEEMASRIGVETKPELGWRTFEADARRYFSELWEVDLRSRSVEIGETVVKQFDLVSPDHRYVGDAKWLKNIKTPAAKWQGIAEYIWLLQKVRADKTFMVFGQDADVAERFLHRFRSLTEPVEFYFLDKSGHRRL